MRNLLFPLLLIVTAALLGPTESSAQDAAIIDSLAATDATISPIAIASIATEAVETSVELREMREHSLPDGLLTRIEAGWQDKQSGLEMLTVETEKSLLGRTDPGWMSEIERQWNTSRKRTCM